jgi:hypothetical protein
MINPVMINNRALWFLTCTLSMPAYGSLSVTLNPSPASPQPVGSTIQWTATATDSQAGTLLYQWQISQPGKPFYVVRDYYNSNVFSWTPTESEGFYWVQVTVQNQTTSEVSSAVVPFTLTSLVTGSTPVVTATAHPLVALYSAPGCPSGGYMRVIFETSSEPNQATSWKACTPNRSMNFLVAGMRAGTTYSLVGQTVLSGAYTKSSSVSFTTGPLPSSTTFPSSTVTVGPDSHTAVQEPVILQMGFDAGFPGGQTLPIATDLAGTVLWYYAPFAAPAQIAATMYRPLTGGYFLVAANDPTNALDSLQIFREIDLLGNPVRETNVPRVSQQLVAMGQGPITQFNHDAIQLPNGHLMLIASNEELLTNVQGPGTVDVIGNVLVELDANLQVVWAWNAFNYLDTSRKATLNETCYNGQLGCPPLLLASIANDWLHGNSLSYDTIDENIIFSLRSQDWVIKIDYKNGAGSGDVLWRLGLDGNFTITPPPTDPYPWFSHQHDAEYAVPGENFISLFDDGNVRKTLYPDADSRGQLYKVNETAFTVTQPMNADLGTYSMALGSAQALKNGNFAFGSGLIMTTSPVSNQSVEVLPNGTIDYVLATTGASYRDFRMYSLYEK